MLSSTTNLFELKQNQKCSEYMPNGSQWPRISIVTPSYNQGQFIEQTIRSVLLQSYPNLEYIIIDGGSTDNTVEVIKKYEQYITYWVSEPDEGQSHAINKGFERCTGEIMAWLNSDDFYLPNALENVAKIFVKQNNVDLITGAWLSYDEETKNLIKTRACGTGAYPSLSMMLSKHAHLGQHSTFWRSRVWQKVGNIREDLHYAMDHEFFLRCCDAGCKFKLTSQSLAAFRRYPAQKTGSWDSYANESQKAISEYKIARPQWNSYWGRLRLYLAKLLRSVLHHRNIHPRLGLVPCFDRVSVKQWIKDLSINY